ncbi:MAG: hypothetical protein IT336_07970 [Thermomicrobiales bacterium]|nr:hypothetical protein [Thermomicrobiales bacterium]
MTWRIEARGPEGRVKLAAVAPGDPDPAVARTGERAVFYGAPMPGYVNTTVYERIRLTPGARLMGPAIVEEPAATTVLGPGDRGEINPYGALVVRRGGAA